LELIRYQAFILGEDDTFCGNYGGALRDQLINQGYEDEEDGETIRIGLPPKEPDSHDSRRSYRVFRTYTPSDNTLIINHVIAYAPPVSGLPAHPRYNTNASYASIPDENNPNRVTTLSTEVIPDAALSC